MKISRQNSTENAGALPQQGFDNGRKSYPGRLNKSSQDIDKKPVEELSQEEKVEIERIYRTYFG